MRRISIVALMILAFPILACSQQPKSTCTEPQQVSASDDEIVLTVCNHTYGMAPLAQPRLYFRLHKSGRVEYEVEAESDYLTGVVDNKLSIGESKIDASDVAEIIRLGRTADFQNAAAVYPRYEIWDDSSLESTLIFKYQGREKRIVVNNFSPDGARKKAHYPPSLLAMLERVWKLRPPDHTPSVRDILINQPDYIATETFTSAFMGHGFVVTYKTAKRMDCYRRQSETQITYSCLNQPNTIFYPGTREYSEEARPKGAAADSLFLSDVQTFARERSDAKYSLVGTEKIGEQECLKIEAKVTYKGASRGWQEFVYVFYAARNLNNLVIGVDLTGKETYASSRLSNIRLDFPDRLFKRPEGYRLKDR
jgi:hypothetical protein